MKHEFDDILDICLDRITAKGDTIEQCLASYPERAAELKPLLEAALSAVKASSGSEPRPEFHKLAKHRLLSAIEQEGKKKAEPRMPLWRWQRRWAMALTVVLVIVMACAGTVTASASSLPGDNLYPVKVATEKVQGFFTFGSEAKANFHMKLAERRLDEIRSLVQGNRTVPQSVLARLGTETNGAIEKLIESKEVRRESIERLVQAISNQETVLQQLMEDASPKAKGKFREALERSEHARDRSGMLQDRIPKTRELQISPSPP